MTKHGKRPTGPVEIRQGNIIWLNRSPGPTLDLRGGSYERLLPSAQRKRARFIRQLVSAFCLRCRAALAGLARPAATTIPLPAGRRMDRRATP